MPSSETGAAPSGQQLRFPGDLPNTPADQSSPLTGEEARSKVFCQTYRSAIKALCDEMLGLTHGGGLKGLQQVPASFNPIRDLLEEEDALRARMYGGGGFDIHGLTLSH